MRTSHSRHERALFHSSAVDRRATSRSSSSSFVPLTHSACSHTFTHEDNKDFFFFFLKSAFLHRTRADMTVEACMCIKNINHKPCSGTTSSLRVITPPPQNTHSHSYTHTRTVTHAHTHWQEAERRSRLRNKTFSPVIFRLWCVQSPSDRRTPGSSQVSPPDCQGAHGG